MVDRSFPTTVLIVGTLNLYAELVSIEISCIDKGLQLGTSCWSENCWHYWRHNTHSHGHYGLSNARDLSGSIRNSIFWYCGIRCADTSHAERPAFGPEACSEGWDLSVLRLFLRLHQSRQYFKWPLSFLMKLTMRKSVSIWWEWEENRDGDEDQVVLAVGMCYVERRSREEVGKEKWRRQWRQKPTGLLFIQLYCVFNYIIYSAILFRIFIHLINWYSYLESEY